MSRTRVLVVEDEAIVAADLAEKLGHLGYEVAGIAADGEEALALACRERPHLVLMDIRLEGSVDGIETAEAMRLRVDVPVIYLTAHSDPDTLARAKLTGPFGYVLKPFEDRDLATQIELALYKHKADRQIREQREWLRVMLTSIGDAVIAADADSRITFVNRAAESVTGWSAGEAVGRPIDSVFRLIDEQAGDPPKETVASVLGEDGTISPTSYNALVTRNGRRVPIENSAAPILDSAGQVIGEVIVFRDVTERRQAEEERQSLKSRLHQAQKLEAIGTLAGGIAHDFNNILAAILGYTELALEELPQNSSSPKHLRHVLNAVHRAKDLIGQILVFSRQGEAHAREPVFVAPVVKEALRLLRATLPTTIEIRQNISREPHMVLGDPSQLHQIILNLCANAAHAMRESGGVLEITLGRIELDAASVGEYQGLRPGSFVKLTVSDTGQGMDSATLDRIFEPYFTTKRFGEGSGLGLAVVHGIVRRHEGDISVRSEPGKGATFEILLPGIADSPKHMQVGLSPVPRGTERILVVDDEAPLAALSQRLLALLGYRVTALSSSLEALDLFRSDPHGFDLVITDYTMPHMTGVSLAKQMMEVRPDIPVILCTGYTEMIDEATAREIGIRAFVMKPVAQRDIAALIRGILDEQPG
jgi:hypothetical protein